MKPLWESTRDLHHACEKHPVGQAMSLGTPPQKWYSDWLNCLLMMHEIIDAQVSPLIHRAERLKRDIENMHIKPRENKACQEFCSRLLQSNDLIEGTIYVLTGAHLMGGEIMRRRLIGYPVSHLQWDSRQDAIKELDRYRSKSELTESARECFGALLKIMDEIIERDSMV